MRTGRGLVDSVIILLSVGLLGLAGCSSGGDSAPSTSEGAAATSPESPAPGTSDEAAAPAADPKAGAAEAAGGSAELSAQLTQLLAGFSADERGRSNPLAGDAAAVELGRSEYMSMCFSCHGAEGRGDGPASGAIPGKPSNLADPVRAGKLSDGDRFLVMRHGIPGTSMPASGASLNDEQIWRILAYVQTLPN